MADIIPVVKRPKIKIKTMSNKRNDQVNSIEKKRYGYQPYRQPIHFFPNYNQYPIYQNYQYQFQPNRQNLRFSVSTNRPITVFPNQPRFGNAPVDVKIEQ